MFLNTGICLLSFVSLNIFFHIKMVCVEHEKIRMYFLNDVVSVLHMKVTIICFSRFITVNFQVSWIRCTTIRTSCRRPTPLSGPLRSTLTPTRGSSTTRRPCFLSSTRQKRIKKVPSISVSKCLSKFSGFVTFQFVTHEM